MSRDWVLGLLVATAAVIYLVLRLLTRRTPSVPVDIALDEPARPRPQVIRFAEVDDTAPAVLSPPEWSPPKKAA